LLCVIFKEVHTSVWPTSLLEVDQILGLLDEVGAPVGTGGHQVELVLSLSVVSKVCVLRMPHLRFARFTIVLPIACCKVVALRRVGAGVHLLLVLEIVIILFNARFALIAVVSWRC
jgi:hypothetical protein